MVEGKGVTTSTCKGLFELIYPFVDIAYFICSLLLLYWSPLLAIKLPSPCLPGLLPVYTIPYHCLFSPFKDSVVTFVYKDLLCYLGSPSESILIIPRLNSFLFPCAETIALLLSSQGPILSHLLTCTYHLNQKTLSEKTLFVTLSWQLSA